MQVLAAVPLRHSISPKSRLASVLSPDTRRRLSLQMASRVLAAISDSGARPLILAADSQVMDWAEREGWEAVLDREPSLNAAARRAVERARAEDLAWMVAHADLPLVTGADMMAAVDIIGSGRWLLAPSSDGGTSLIGGLDHHGVQFAYGKGSFHRHLLHLGDRLPQIVSRLGLALDLDRPSDLRAALSHPRGRWIQSVLTAAEIKATRACGWGNLA